MKWLYNIDMKRIIILTLFSFSVVSIMGNTARSSPIYPYNIYGGYIFFKNTSSYNQYWEIERIDNYQGGFYFDHICLEKNDIIRNDHFYHVHWDNDSTFDTSIVNPNKHFKTIRVYNMENGILMYEFNAGDIIFNLISGDGESNSVWDISISD